MRQRDRRSEDWPIVQIGPILEHYGGEPTDDDRGWYAYRCPFHSDRTASASVNTAIHVFVCHTCDTKGNAVQLIMKKEGKSYGDALTLAEKIAGKGNTDIRESRGRSGKLSGRTGNKSGSRAFRRTWRS